MRFPILHRRQWLARSARGDLEIDWRNFDEPSRLDGFVGLLLRDAEREAFDSGEFTTRRVDSDWRAARTRGPTSNG